MAINFPDSPNNGDSFTSNNKTWVFDGTVWNITSGTNSVADGAITAAKIASSAVTSDKIAAGAVDTTDLASGAVTTAKIANNTITQAKLDSTLSAITIGTSSTKPASPFDGQVIYMTDVDQTAVWDGSAWVGLDPSRDRNVIINGAMQVAQRGTSTTGKTGGGYATVDRFQAVISSLGTWTETVENDAPTGLGFRKSWKLACTTANASPAAGNYMVAYQIIEGQNLQNFAKGTASAKQFTLSFWVKGTTIGTYVVELYDNNNTRAVSASYTISAPDTWEKKILVFPSDTTGAFTNDNGGSLTVQWWLGAGSTFTAGSLATSWGAINNANRAVGQTNLAGATSRSWQITGVQLEAGAVATPFEFEDFGMTLAKCQRYFQKSFRQDVAPATATNNFDGVLQWQGNGGGFGAWCHRSLPVIMRSAPVVTLFNPVSANAQARNTASNLDIQSCTATGYTSAITTVASGTNDAASQGSAIHYTLSSEL